MLWSILKKHFIVIEGKTYKIRNQRIKFIECLKYLKILITNNYTIYFLGGVASFVLFIALICCISGKIEVKDFFEGVLVEATGFVFDILLFGIILGLYSKHIEIKGYKNEIEFFRGWDSKEGMRRTVGNIKLLNEEKISAIKLNFCILIEANLIKVDLSKALLVGTNLEKADLREANLKGAILVGANLKNIVLLKADLRVTDLQGVNLTEADLQEANLRGADLRKVNLSRAKLVGAKVSDDNWIANLEKWEVIGFEEIKEKYKIISKNSDKSLIKDYRVQLKNT